MTSASANNPLNRRQFLGRSAQNAAGVAAGVVGLSGAARAGSRNKVRLGVIGVHNRGAVLAKAFAELPHAEVAVLCDLDVALLPPLAKEVEQLQSAPPRIVSDYRRLLDDPRIDAVVIATPNHWHAAMATEAVECGKHVYLEVPVTRTIDESETLLALANEFPVVVAAGLQQRSSDVFRSAMEFVREGRLGTVPFARAWTVYRRKPVESAATRGPRRFDVDQWRGPATADVAELEQPHFHWRWHWGFGAGELGNWGVHMLDIARWGLGVEWPQRVCANGGVALPADAQQTPDVLSVQYGFGGPSIVWEHRLWSTHPPEGRSNGVAFHGSEGTLVVDRGGWKVYDSREKASFSGSADVKPHLQNFLDAIRHGDPLHADLSVGHVSSALCHLGNESYRAERELRFDSGEDETPAPRPTA